MSNPKDITDPTAAMNMALVLMAKEFKLNYSTLTNNIQRISSNPRNRQIVQPGMNLGHDRQMEMVRGCSECVQNSGIQNVRNQNGLIVVLGIADPNVNQIRNGNVVAARAEGNAYGNNGDLEEIEKVNANCILIANLQQASTWVHRLTKPPSMIQTDQLRIMDPNSSLEKICLWDDVVIISSDKVEGSGDWNSPEYQDTIRSKGKKVINTLSFYRMETYEISERYIAPCFVNGLEAYDGEVNFVPKIGEELPLFICKMWKRSRNKKRTMENLNLFFQDIGPSSSARGHLTQEEAEKEALAVRISQKFALLEEERPVIKTMAYNDKYKKILDEIWRDKVELDGKAVKEEEDAVKRIKGEALKKKEDPGAFIFSIRLEGKVNENALANTGSYLNTMPYRIYEKLGREEMKKIDRGITMIIHTEAEAMGKLSNVLCQVRVTTIIIKFLILDIPIDRNAPIVVGRGFLYTSGSILNTPDRFFSTFDGVCHQTFRAARFDVLRTAESDSDDEEEYVIKRNKLRAPIYGLKPAPYINCTYPEDRSSAI
nr:hypothetical protein [Tanacetum cinerariifolium]